MDFNPNSMCIWWPVVAKLDIPVPKTVIVQAPEECPDLLNEFFYACSDGLQLPTGWGIWWPAAKESAVEYLGGGPYFMRTDLHSGKHEWIRTCFCPDASSFDHNIFALLEDWHCGFTSGFNPRAIVFREFLDLMPGFTAFREMPVAQERRYFISGGKVLCHHSYWIESAVAQWPPKDMPEAEWKDTLRALNEQPPAEVAYLTAQAEKVAAVLPGFWSVDFAWSADGNWYLIDMATGEESWHHPECEYSSKEESA